MKDKRTESQFPDINKVDHGDTPEGFGTMTPEAENEQADAEERKRTAIPYLSRNAEDILNSKRSRGERL
jgi:hypothetical protein